MTTGFWNTLTDGVEVELRVPGDAQGVTVRLNTPRVANNWEGIGFPDEARDRLSIPRGEKLFIKRSYEPLMFTQRRISAFAAIRERITAAPVTGLGLVPLYATGIAEDYKAHLAVKDHPNPVAVYEVMQDAGHVRLSDAISRNREEAWGADGQYAAVRAMLPAAISLEAMHSLEIDDWPHGSALAHRDIKPSNMFITFPGSDFHQAAIRGVDVRWEGPLVRLADYGLFYFSNHDPHVTTTTVRGSSPFWTPWDVTLGESENNPKARDIWSFGATLFYGLTGNHPWTSVDQYMREAASRTDKRPDQRMFESAEMMKSSPRPDSPAFYDLDPRLRSLIRKCLGHHTERPNAETVAATMLSISQQYFHGKAVEEGARAREQKATMGLKVSNREEETPATHRSAATAVKRRRRFKWDVAILICVLLVLGAAGYGAFVRQYVPTGTAPSTETPSSVPTATPTVDSTGVATLASEGFTNGSQGVWTKSWAVGSYSCRASAIGTCFQFDVVTPLLDGCPKGIQAIVLFDDPGGGPGDITTASTGPAALMQRSTLYVDAPRAVAYKTAVISSAACIPTGG